MVKEEEEKYLRKEKPLSKKDIFPKQQASPPSL